MNRHLSLAALVAAVITSVATSEAVSVLDETSLPTATANMDDPTLWNIEVSARKTGVGSWRAAIFVDADLTSFDGGSHTVEGILTNSAGQIIARDYVDLTASQPSGGLFVYDDVDALSGCAQTAISCTEIFTFELVGSGDVDVSWAVGAELQDTSGGTGSIELTRW